jgi:hypothetical protein
VNRDFPRSIALINPLPDFGIDSYTHELAQGLADAGIRTDVYASDSSKLRVQTRPNYRRFHVLGSRLPSRILDATIPSDAPIPSGAGASPPTSQSQPSAFKTFARDRFLPFQLAMRLRRERYDVVWTQWPELGAYSDLWQWCRILRIPVVHTVHNIFPHERSDGDVEISASAYRAARVLFVHSTPVLEELSELFPAYASKAVVIPHGTYTMYPRVPEVREQLRTDLKISPQQTVLLVCGAIRGYKNVNACIDAVATLHRDDIILVIAGSEPGAPKTDPLPETTARVHASSAASQVRLLPGFRDERGMAELFETSDVLMLPYLKSYGSGLLMLGITFGKTVLATRPGMEETASQYPRSILLSSGSVDDLRVGIERAVAMVTANSRTPVEIPQNLQWSNIAVRCADSIRKHLTVR